MIVGIDIGTQSLKVVVTDDDLNVFGEAATAYQPSFPIPGWAEQDPAVWEKALAPTIARALSNANVQTGDVSAIGIGGQLDGCVPVDNHGNATHPCIIWMDRRAEEQIIGLPVEEIQERTGVNLDSTHLAAKIRWLKENTGETGQGSRYHVPVSYLIQRLTGIHVVDHAHASTSMLYSLNNRMYDPWLLDLFDIGEHELPSIADATDIAGSLTREGARLTGLSEGTLMAVGTGDDFSTPLGAGISRPGRVTCVLGTAEVVGALHDKPIIDNKGLVETHAYVGGGFFIENPGWLSGGALEWFRSTFRIDSFKELDALASDIPPGAGGVTFLPGLSGTMSPKWVASARGCFYGLTPACETGHMARAMLEGTAFAMRDVIERLMAMGVESRSILVLGGGAKSQVWAQVRADLTGLPVDIPTITDTAPIGSAILAAVAASIQPDLISATNKVGDTRLTIEPNHSLKASYDVAYESYQKLFHSLVPMF